MRTFRRIWRYTYVDPHFGMAQAGKFRPIQLFQFANDPTKDMLAEYIGRLVGELSIPRHKWIGRDYLKQLTAERREEAKDARGRLRFVWKRVLKDNHLWDCELMILVAAVVSKVVATGAIEFKPKPSN